MTLLVVKDFTPVEEFGVPGADGPRACIPGVNWDVAPGGDGAPDGDEAPDAPDGDGDGGLDGGGKGGKAGGDGITEVLKGFPVLLQGIFNVY